MEPLLNVEHLTKVFHSPGRLDCAAVRDVSFSLYSGEKLAIIGESGSGKTTLANLITRLLDATSGRIVLDGTDITDLRGRRLSSIYRKVQMVFQSPVESFNPRYTLGDGVAEGLINLGMDKKQALAEAEKLLLSCGLAPELSGRYPSEVSGGQCQRAAIARALALRPKLLILDEATSALDVTVQKDILDLLSRIQKENGMSYLFICHDIALVQNFCDRALVMYRGQIMEEGTPDEIIDSPKDPYTKRMIDSIL